ncbi:hypothetical protein PV326_014059, partial [Microctonus aethiopoides]
QSSNFYVISSMKNPKIPSITITSPTAAVQPPNEPLPLHQVSLPSDDSRYTLTEFMKRAQFNIEKAQNLQANKQSPKPLNLLVNKPKKNDSINEPTTSSKLLRISATSNIKKTPRKPKMSTYLTVKYITISESSEAFESDVAGAQSKVTTSKIKSFRTFLSSLSVNLTSKRRVSAITREFNIRSSPSTKGDVSQVKTSIIRRSTSGESSSIDNALTSQYVTSTAMGSILKSELDSNIKKPTSNNLSKFVITKK